MMQRSRPEERASAGRSPPVSTQKPRRRLSKMFPSPRAALCVCGDFPLVLLWVLTAHSFGGAQGQWPIETHWCREAQHALGP